MRGKIAPVLWIILLLGIPAGLYYLYFSAQVQRITELNQRELGRASENLKEILGNGVQTLRNLSKTPGYTCDFNDRQPYLQLADDLHCNDFKLPEVDGNSVGPESDIDASVTEHGIR